MHLNRSFFLLGVAFLIIFSAFSYLIKTDVLNKLDFILMVKIQDKVPHSLNSLLSSVSLLAKFEVITILLLILLVLRRDVASVIFFFIYGFGHVIEVVGKHALHQPTPPYMFFRQEGVAFFRDYVKPGFSYPSGHAFRAIFIALILSYIIHTSKRLKYKNITVVILFVTAGLIGLSKVILGQHWPTDIVGGAFLGISVGLLSLSFYRKSSA